MELREEVARGIADVACIERVDAGVSAAADAAIAIVLRKVEQHLSAVQYDPSPYTALKHRLAELTPTR